MLNYCLVLKISYGNKSSIFIFLRDIISGKFQLHRKSINIPYSQTIGLGLNHLIPSHPIFLTHFKPKHHEKIKSKHHGIVWRNCLCLFYIRSLDIKVQIRDIRVCLTVILKNFFSPFER